MWASETGDVKVSVKSGDLPPDQSAKLTQVAELSVGDKSASEAQNSAKTVERSKGDIETTARYKVTQSPPKVPETPPAKSNENTTYSGEPGQYFICTNNFTYLLEGGASGRWIPTSGEFQNQSARDVRTVPASLETPQTLSHYILHAFDVHDMGPGSSPSMIHIRGKNQEILKSIKLAPGSSQVHVDLPPGEYTFEAVSGKRPDDAKTEDKHDNFGVKIYRDDKKTETTSKTNSSPRTVGRA